MFIVQRIRVDLTHRDTAEMRILAMETLEVELNYFWLLNDDSYGDGHCLMTWLNNLSVRETAKRNAILTRP